MKFCVTFKTPDAVRDSTENEAEWLARKTVSNDPTADYGDEKNAEWDKLIDFTKTWVRYGELITVEFDTDAGTAEVLKC